MKARGITLSQKLPRIKGLLVTVATKKFGIHTQSWPRKPSTPPTKYQLKARGDFAKAVWLIKRCTSDEYQIAQGLAKDSLFIFRDLLMSAAYGKLVSAIDVNGLVWKGLRTMPDPIDELLDAITDIPGSVLFRGADEWLGLAPGLAGQFLQLGLDGVTPQWASVVTALPAATFNLNNADQTSGITVGAYSLVQLDNAAFNNTATFNPSTHEIAPFKGKYIVTFLVAMTATAPAADGCEASLFINGSPGISGVYINTPGSTTYSSLGCSVVEFSGTDLCDLRAYMPANYASIDGLVNATYVSFVRISD